MWPRVVITSTLERGADHETLRGQLNFIEDQIARGMTSQILCTVRSEHPPREEQFR